MKRLLAEPSRLMTILTAQAEAISDIALLSVCILTHHKILVHITFLEGGGLSNNVP